MTKGITMKKIFKNIIFTVLSLVIIPIYAKADDITEVKNVFNNYVAEANNYSNSLPDYYTNNAKIIRVVNKKQGGQRAIIIPRDRYIKELTGRSVLAKAVNYKNRYVNIKVSKHNGGYKVSATRIPRNDKTGLPCYFIFIKQDGNWKIKEESMTTNVQTFLSAK